MATQGMDSPRGQSAGPSAGRTAPGGAHYPPPPPPPPRGYSPQPTAAPAGVRNYMAQAILCTIFLFLPTGIAAIYNAAKVNPALQVGDVAGATQASSKAKMFCWISLGVGAFFWLIIIISSGSSGSA